MQAIRATREWHTGDREEYLSGEEVQRLGEIIQAARVEVESRPELQQDLKKASNAEERMVLCFQALGDTHQARAAINKLVEAHLGFAAYFARASVGILTNKNEVLSGRVRKPGAYSDITRLNSPRAILDDRIQEANLGLIEAAWNYKPKTIGSKGTSSFVSVAKWHIHKRLSLHAGGVGEHPTLSLHHSTMQGLREKSKCPYGSDGCINLDLLQFRGLDKPFDIDEVEGMPAEAASLLENIEKQGLSDAIEEVLGGLGDDANSRRAQEIVKHTFGIGDNQPKSLDEIAKMYGLSRDRVRHIQDQVLKKLRHPSRKNILFPWTTDDTSERDRVQVARRVGLRAVR